MKNDQLLREHILYLLKGGGAHLNFEAALDRVPLHIRGKRPKGVPHSLWELLEHMRIAQWDILEFSRNPNHISPEFPDGYWPKRQTPPNPGAWVKSVRAFRADLEALCELIANQSTDLSAAISHGEGQTILREALLVADHNAYHLGQFVLVRRLLGAWDH